MHFILLFLSLFATCWSAQNRQPSHPYISGDTFRHHCRIIYDETHKRIDPTKVQPGDVIFVKTDLLSDFFTKIHPRIRHPYKLLTHNSDHGIPGRCISFLDDPKLLAWHGTNVEIYHPKLHPIPIGLANRYWPHGNVDLLDELRKQPFQKSILLYLNFAQETFPTERTRIYHLFHNQPYCFSPPKKRIFPEYLLDLGQSCFILSPRGNGLDCHRTWESLWMGAIPIVKSSAMDPMYDHLPVLIVHDWNEITEEFLQQKWVEFSLKEFQTEKLFIDYWISKIFSKLG